MTKLRRRRTRRRSVNAATALSSAGIDPDDVRALLPTVDPATVLIMAASALMRRTWAKGIGAVTMPWAVYVTPSIMDRIEGGDEPERYGQLVVHELAHLHQYRSAGATKHLFRYVADYLRGRRGGLDHWDAYRGIEAEVEARTIADRFAAPRGPR